MALVFKSTANSIDDRVADVRGAMDDAKVLAAGLAYNAGVAVVAACAHTIRDLAIQITGHLSGSGVMQGSKFGMLQGGVGDGFWVTRKELNDVRRQTCFLQDLLL